MDALRAAEPHVIPDCNMKVMPARDHRCGESRLEARQRVLLQPSPLINGDMTTLRIESHCYHITSKSLTFTTQRE